MSFRVQFQVFRLRKVRFIKSDTIMGTTLLTSLTITIFLQLFTLNIVPVVSAKGGIGSYCTTYTDCDQKKLLECHRERNTCDCALNSVFSGIQGKCVQHVGERCIIHINKVGGPLPEVGCVDNAKCEREPNSRRAFNQGVCTCSHGYYRTIDNFCHTNPTTTASTSNNQKYSPSLHNVVNSLSNQDSKSTSSSYNHQKKDPDPYYHHPLTRSFAVPNYHYSTQIISLSLISFIVIFLLNS